MEGSPSLPHMRVCPSPINKFERINWTEYLKKITETTALRSSCDRLHVGCILVKDKRIISTGYNGFLSGCEHKSIVRNNHEQCTMHAEANCISDCSKRGVSTDNSEAYITHYPCLNCCKLLLCSGIKKIYYINNYKNDNLVKLLSEQKEVDIIQI